VRKLEISLSGCWPARKVLVPARWIGSINWSQSLVIVDAPREGIQSGPAFDHSALADPAYETWLQRAYTRLHT
jgi:hypothetical protein